jgi:hypothetical protein
VLTAEELAALETSDEVPLWVTLPFFGLFVGIGSFMAGVGVGSKTGFPLMFGSLFAGIPFLMSLVFNSSAYVLGPLGVAVFIYGFRTGRRKPAWVTEMRSSGRRGGGSGWVMGTSSSSSGGSSSRSSGGGSFGGGSSGGGGASGRW